MSKTILITGATSGIGRHAAIDLARRGHRVIATGRSERGLAEVREEGKGLDLRTVVLDVTDAGSIARAHQTVLGMTDQRGVDVLINNAGFGQCGPTIEVDDAMLRAQFETNVFGLMAVTRTFAQTMMNRGEGRILLLSSVGGQVTLPLFGVYNATKYAIESLGDAMRMELAPLGIDVVLIEPGAIRTEFNTRAADSAGFASSSRWAAVQRRGNRVLAYTDRIAPDPAPISRAIARAVEARRPRARYMAPFRDAMFVSFVRALPTWLADKLMARIYHLHRVEAGPVVRPAITTEEPLALSI